MSSVILHALAIALFATLANTLTAFAQTQQRLIESGKV
jgi:hypothetical protein